MSSFTESTHNLLEAGRKQATEKALAEDIFNEREAKRRLMLIQNARVEQTVQRFEHAAMKNGGMRPKVEIPQLAYHSWAAKFKERDMKAGITTTTGYECWNEGSGFYEWWLKKNPRMQYREAKKCAQSSIIVASKYDRIRKAA